MLVDDNVSMRSIMVEKRRSGQLIDQAELSARLYDLMPRIIAVRARGMGGSEVPFELLLASLTERLAELNRQMSELTPLVDKTDLRLVVLASAAHKVADGISSLLDTIEGHLNVGQSR